MRSRLCRRLCVSHPGGTRRSYGTTCVTADGARGDADKPDPAAPSVPSWQSPVARESGEEYPLAVERPPSDDRAAQRPPVLPISSTPLPFHRNLTTLPTPSALG
ncbi:hypothetical protein Mkiyose1665_52790 [Mycobacterium kiyosense]|nr:hypothetical protein IWGMT90018_48050 [Mycobacterium kiyosense]BDE15883.1 hypothetical protein MKCMC460_47430 [Mycobacterium sp. 20KCMC460]GLB92061.1 hypothetical protein SRL2020130_48780 [Mycobacterium kiyosense]GLB99412.1 hypothetical protein SRL2020400_00040 [Mycobacterium kiyosense]GLC06331.1 hypothetical protein SRL2020411_09770 [Mycobacterium kiyosense]